MSQDIELLQGSWRVSALEMDGEPMPAAAVANARIDVTGDRFRTTGMGSEYEGVIELDATASPRRLDMKFDAGPEKGNTNPGIYELNGDTWKICLATRGALRPSSFKSTPGSGFAVEILTRGAGPKAASQARSTAPATEFEGEWLMVSGIMNGSAMDESTMKWVKRVTQGDQTTVYAGPQVMMKVAFTSDASQSPKTIDYRNLAGSHKGKTQYGIYEYDGDLLKVCVAAPGAPRPAKFESNAGEGATLTVWKRA